MSGSQRPGIPFVIAAPSGTGKTTVCRQLALADETLENSVSHTTRPLRTGEVDGVNYHFVALDTFEELIDKGQFLEWAVYNSNHYGTSWEAIEAPLAAGRDMLLEIEIQGARQVKKRLPHARLIFLLPPSMQVLEDRLRGRGTDSDDQIRARLDTASSELAAIHDFDYVIFNDDLKRCIAEVQSLLAAERSGDTEALRADHDPDTALARFHAG